MKFIDKNYLEENPNHIFVFGDNILRVGYGGAAILRDLPNTYGFVTKRFPNNNDESFYKPDIYKYVYELEMQNLRNQLESDPVSLYLISKLGAGLANKYNIFDKIIKPNLKNDLQHYKNVEFLY